MFLNVEICKPRSKITEAVLLDKILDKLSDAQRNQLVKLSVAQLYTARRADLCPTLKRTNGKYYFS